MGGAWPKRTFASETGRCNDDHPQSRMRVGEEIIELYDDDETSVASEDEADDKAAVEGGEEGNKDRRVENSSDTNDNVWPRSGLHARSYYCKLTIWKKLIRGEGQIFQLAEVFRQVMCKFAIANHFNYRYERNCKQRIVARCDATDCSFYIWVRGGKNWMIHTFQVVRTADVAVFNYSKALASSSSQCSQPFRTIVGIFHTLYTMCCK